MPNGQSSSVNSSASHPRCETTTAARTNWRPGAGVSPREFSVEVRCLAPETDTIAEHHIPFVVVTGGWSPAFEAIGASARSARRWNPRGHRIGPSLPEPRQRRIQRYARHADAQRRCLSLLASLTIVLDRPSVTVADSELREDLVDRGIEAGADTGRERTGRRYPSRQWSCRSRALTRYRRPPATGCRFVKADATFTLPR